MRTRVHGVMGRGGAAAALHTSRGMHAPQWLGGALQLQQCMEAAPPSSPRHNAPPAPRSHPQRRPPSSSFSSSCLGRARARRPRPLQQGRGDGRGGGRCSSTPYRSDANAAAHHHCINQRGGCHGPRASNPSPTHCAVIAAAGAAAGGGRGPRMPPALRLPTHLPGPPASPAPRSPPLPCCLGPQGVRSFAGGLACNLPTFRPLSLRRVWGQCRAPDRPSSGAGRSGRVPVQCHGASGRLQCQPALLGARCWSKSFDT